MRVEMENNRATGFDWVLLGPWGHGGVMESSQHIQEHVDF